VVVTIAMILLVVLGSNGTGRRHHVREHECVLSDSTAVPRGASALAAGCSHAGVVHRAGRCDAATTTDARPSRQHSGSRSPRDDRAGRADLRRARRDDRPERENAVGRLLAARAGNIDSSSTP
jgi:hypothetical protein